jgi:cytoskeletal protein RodZ
MMKASERAAWIVLAGLFLLSAGAAQAAPSSAASTKPDGASKQADAGKQRHHAARRHTDSKAAQKSDDKTNSADATPQTGEAKTGNEADNKPDNKADNAATASSQMPPVVANANAQLAAADTPPAAAASAMTGRANDNVQAAADDAAAPAAENQVVAPDQLNDLDRALQQDNPPAQKAVIAATDAQPRPAPVMASSQPSSAWDQSSLIGKIFIGVGTLLTLASAARMFMA